MEEASYIVPWIEGLITHLADTPILGVGLTLVAYHLGAWLFGKFNRPVWLPPIVTGTLMLSLFIFLLPISYNQYLDGAKWISFLLGPATVALAIPLYLQFHYIRQLAKPVTLTLLIGAPLMVGSALLVGWGLGADYSVLLSIAPKSVTAPIAVGLAETLGGIPPLAVGIVAITGILTSVAAPIACRILNIQDERILGFIMGMNGHGAATARAFEISPKVGAFSSLAMGLTGAAIALALPLCIYAFTGSR